MKVFKKVLKYLGLSLLTIFVLILIIGTLFMNLSPQFGGKPTEEEIAAYNNLVHFENGVFKNIMPTAMEMDFKKGMGLLGKQISGIPNGKPSFQIPIEKVEAAELATQNKDTKLIWFGHSAFLLQINGYTFLIDPMLGNVPAPHPLLGPSRFNKELPIRIEELPRVDAILISHDHYDHLDYESIQKLKEKTKQFIVPLGVGAHFKAWGIEEERIKELSWWDEITYQDVKFVFTPSRHFSGRGFKRNTTLWGSWVIIGEKDKIYFSGDGGYGSHFKEIGNKYGPFDFAMMECGQYNENWSQIHMMPEETAQAAIDVQAKLMMPIHWGAFKLALHSWTDPIERVTNKADELGVQWIAPKIGQPIYMDHEKMEQDFWWIEK